MIGFEVHDGDLVIVDNDISVLVGNDLTTQTIQSVLSTNKGEWLFNADEGIDFDNILGVRYSGQTKETEDIFKSEIEQGVGQVDPSLTVEDFTCQYNDKTRVLGITFTAKRTDSGETTEIKVQY